MSTQRDEKVKIEHGIPIPANASGVANRKYPFAQMKIGDSILVSVKSRQSAYAYKLRHPEFKFVTRRVSSTHVRLWRVGQ